MGYKSLSEYHDILMNKVPGLLRNIIVIYGINRIIYSTNLLPYSVHHNPTQGLSLMIQFGRSYSSDARGLGLVRVTRSFSLILGRNRLRDSYILLNKVAGLYYI